ncbi:Imm1 family immunity protein [Actinokineospora inagensis]|uniref:Imm1 family immunity protein n=1 Tax=Actinokineospora inagensis TaxID=103730 RepID=UPI0004187F62|nr:Imm1 family immunity protein [Actinokineospora inagensis]
MKAIRAFYRYEDEDGHLLADLAAVRAMVERVRADSVAYDAPLLSLWYIDGDDDTPEFGVGVHGDVGVLSYTGPGLWSSHNGDLAAGEPIIYSYMSNASEFPACAQIPYADVLAAAEAFFTSGGDRPGMVVWREEGAG